MSDESPARARVRKELLRVRDLAGISARGMARILDVNRGVVQRFDTGRGRLSLETTAHWLDACGVTGDERERILELAEHAASETRPWRDLFVDRGHLQDQVRAEEADAAEIRGFQPTIWPGLLQTPEYARLVLGAGHTKDVEGAVAARVRRQQVLYEGRARFSYLVGERPLRADFGNPAILTAQIDRALSVARLDDVDVRVVPDSAPSIVWHGFVVTTTADRSEYVKLELVHGEQRIWGEEDVAVYRRTWEELTVASVDLAEWLAR